MDDPVPALTIDEKRSTTPDREAGDEMDGTETKPPAGDAAAEASPLGDDAAEASSADDAAAEASPADGDRRSHGARVRTVALFAVLVAAIAAAVTGGTVWTMRHSDATSAAERDRTVLSATSAMAAQLVTLRASTADADVKRIQADATGTFLSQLTDSTGGFTDILTQGKVDSTGKATQVAVEKVDGDRATTLAAVTSTVKNSETPQGEQRVYRMRLTLERGDGRWLVSNVEFVS